MIEVIRWISFVLMWIAVGMNLYAMYLSNRLRKYYELRLKEVEAWIAYKKEQGEWHSVEVEVSDESM